MGESTDKIEATDALETTTGADHNAGNEPQDVAELRRHIEETRDDLSQTIDALQERLNPATLKQQVTDATIGKAEELANTAKEKVSAKTAPVGRLVKRFPIPCAVAGVVLLLVVGHLMRGHSDENEGDEDDTDDIDLYGPVYEDDDIEVYEYDVEDD